MFTLSNTPMCSTSLAIAFDSKTKAAMATRTIYLTVRLDLCNPDVDEIPDEDVDEIVREVDYEFKNYGG